MKKEKKQTREQVYREILGKVGRKLDDYKVLAFAFDNERGPEIFHYKLMNAVRPVYHLFDCFSNYAYIVVPKDADNELECTMIAMSCGGEKTIPNMR